ncbi:MAG: ribosome small subunit-dependent GTPase A [Ignavibacteriae bacterium]|nr:ribosome small subunit-dependent GTPase A [Ignavibacteriota bacterium]
MKSIGLTPAIEEHAHTFLDQGFALARVTEENRESYLVTNGRVEIPAEISGKLRFTAESRAHLPAVGDWVIVSLLDNDTQAVIHDVLPRKTLLSRKAAGDKSEQQIIAANVDTIFIVQGLDGNFNLRRLERYLIVAAESGAQPVVLLSKADLLAPGELSTLLAEAKPVAQNVPLIPYSATTGEGIAELQQFISDGTTICFIGSSGVGKSTLINRLTGSELLPTNEVRTDDSRGRHTTTRRQMIILPTGGILIDTPGMRELGLWHAASSLDATFPEIAGLADECKFTDCTHTHEPDCAVQRAVNDGALDEGRYQSYVKLRHEAHWMEERTTVAGRLERKRKEKILSRTIKHYFKQNKHK